MAQSDEPLQTDDPGYCGVGIETGKQDPYWIGKACSNHDEAFNQLKANLRHDNGVKVMGRFAVDSTKVFLRSIYGVVAYPLYLFFGGVVGLFRWSYLKREQEGYEPKINPED